MSVLDSEMREIFDKGTTFSQIAALCGKDKDELLISPRNFQEKALSARNNYAIKLHAISTARDISTEKLKNASSLNIDLVKFKGYESKLDIYSFRNEFEKLIQPTILQRYWSDTPKKNYLSGPALTLVERSETVEDIWVKLIDAYGNVKFLLQNKISNLDRVDCLDKIKGDEKIGNAIAKIINTMTELSDLAQKYNLENKLYIGGGLEKIFSLIGEDRERKFFIKDVEYRRRHPSVANTGSEVSAEKLEWEKLKEFLKKEMDVRERLTVMNKSKNCLGVNSAVKIPPRDKRDKNALLSGSVNNVTTQTVFKCHICDKTDHVLSTDKFRKKYVDYFSCKMFVVCLLKKGVKHCRLKKCVCKVCPQV